ncbi:hypothetical protein LCGC14_1704290 [marine sediment metagenome]|uniref:Uncharacterized protein n=1 Tax=marine sediment metagenome TaxID=412755 RepID=A0A0F9HGR7_9ZZZZ
MEKLDEEENQRSGKHPVVLGGHSGLRAVNR